MSIGKARIISVSEGIKVNLKSVKISLKITRCTNLEGWY